jgi:hypothetical protein
MLSRGSVNEVKCMFSFFLYLVNDHVIWTNFIIVGNVFHTKGTSVARPTRSLAAKYNNTRPASILCHAELLPLGQRPGPFYIHDVSSGKCFCKSGHLLSISAFRLLSVTFFAVFRNNFSRTLSSGHDRYDVFTLKNESATPLVLHLRVYHNLYQDISHVLHMISYFKTHTLSMGLATV